jgi:hypothetical protein
MHTRQQRNGVEAMSAKRARVSEETKQRIREVLLREYPGKTYKEIGVICGVSQWWVDKIGRPMVLSGELKAPPRNNHMKGTKSGDTTFMVTSTPFVERKTEKPTETQESRRSTIQRMHDHHEAMDIKTCVGEVWGD